MAEKEVYYDLWCPKCKHFKTPEFEDPCDECLEESFRDDSHKPLHFEEET